MPRRRDRRRHEAAPAEDRACPADTSGSERARLEPPQSLQRRQPVGGGNRSPRRGRAAAGPRRARRSSPPPFTSARSPVSGLCSDTKAKTSSRVVGSSSSSRCEWPRMSVRSGRARTSSSTMSTPSARAASTAAIVFAGASAAAPRCPIRSSGPFPRRSETSRRRRQRVLLEAPAAGGELEDHPVGDPLDRRTVVRPRVGRRRRRSSCARASKCESGPKLSGAAREPADEELPRLGPVEADHELVEPESLPGEDERELRRQRPGDSLREPVVARAWPRR